MGIYFQQFVLNSKKIINCLKNEFEYVRLSPHTEYQDMDCFQTRTVKEYLSGIVDINLT